MLYSPRLGDHQLPLVTRIPNQPQLPKTYSRTASCSHQFPRPLFVPRFLSKNPTGCSKSYAGCSSSNSSVRPSPEEDDFDVELGRLLLLLPEEMRRKVNEHPMLHQLIEVVMDLGRKPLARFPSGDFVLSDLPVRAKDLEHATSLVGDFVIDNRAGISRTLHRISAIKNRKGAIIGLTCRVGRAISGSANLLRDLVQDGASLLLIGPPGVGKTTIIREIARMLANDYKKRVMIVDTSNEIGGDGDIPHAGIGNARRMQVPNSEVQHKVLIEAVENHMPQVIVIDEIGTKLEAMAASTIAQRGIQLVATAHGITIENLIMNPALEMLVGGIQSVTLGDEEASRRGVQKTVLERKGPSTFSCAVEIVSKSELRVHRSLESTVDAILSGHFAKVEVRKVNCHVTAETTEREPLIDSFSDQKNEIMFEDAPEITNETTSLDVLMSEVPADEGDDFCNERVAIRLFVYGILEASVIQAIKQLKMYDAAIQLTNNISEADALLALQSKLKKNSRIQAAAKSHAIPIHVTKTSSLVQITKAIRALVKDLKDVLKDLEPADEIKSPEKIDALEEARIAIEEVVIPKGEAVELLPRPSKILALQVNLVKLYGLAAERIGSNLDMHLRVLPFPTSTCDKGKSSETHSADGGFGDLISGGGGTNGSSFSVNRLPLLPD